MSSWHKPWAKRYFMPNFIEVLFEPHIKIDHSRTQDWLKAQKRIKVKKKLGKTSDQNVFNPVGDNHSSFGNSRKFLHQNSWDNHKCFFFPMFFSYFRASLI